jgi:hypothetical protein
MLELTKGDSPNIAINRVAGSTLLARHLSGGALISSEVKWGGQLQPIENRKWKPTILFLPVDRVFNGFSCCCLYYGKVEIESSQGGNGMSDKNIN